MFDIFRIREWGTCFCWVIYTQTGTTLVCLPRLEAQLSQCFTTITGAIFCLFWSLCKWDCTWAEAAAASVATTLATTATPATGLNLLTCKLLTRRLSPDYSTFCTLFKMPLFLPLSFQCHQSSIWQDARASLLARASLFSLLSCLWPLSSTCPICERRQSGTL